MLLFCVWTECADGDCPGGPEGPPDGHGGQGSPHTDAVVPWEYQPRRGRPETGSRRTRRRKVPVSYDHFVYINKMKYSDFGTRRHKCLQEFRKFQITMCCTHASVDRACSCVQILYR